MFGSLKNSFDFDDLVFENRNREYGAFQLRKKYSKTVVAATAVASLLACAAVILPVVLSLRPGVALSANTMYYSVQMEGLEPPVDFIVIPPPPPPPSGLELVQETVKYTPPVVIDSVLPVEEKLAAVDEIMNQTTAENSVPDGTGTGDDVFTGIPGGSVNGDPFFFVEVMPSFRGGDLNTFREWVQRNTVYPQAAVDAEIEGQVHITFIVEADGSVSNVTVVNGVAAIIDNEVVRVIKSSPKWSPGLQRGHAMRVRHSMRLNFVL
ncbi:MAG: energy transducer TonB [Bacteroidales bacterium]|jgi:protein TonB|nr:energy transducer TonB [Bacteroidales bacterium]